MAKSPRKQRLTTHLAVWLWIAFLVPNEREAWSKSAQRQCWWYLRLWRLHRDQCRPYFTKFRSATGIRAPFLKVRQLSAAARCSQPLWLWVFACSPPWRQLMTSTNFEPCQPQLTYSWDPFKVAGQFSVELWEHSLIHWTSWSWKPPYPSISHTRQRVSCFEIKRFLGGRQAICFSSSSPLAEALKFQIPSQFVLTVAALVLARMCPPPPACSWVGR